MVKKVITGKKGNYPGFSEGRGNYLIGKLTAMSLTLQCMHNDMTQKDIQNKPHVYHMGYGHLTLS